MPSTARIGRRRNNLVRLNLCFSNLMQPFTPEPPPTSPTQHDIDHNRPSPPRTTSSSIMLKNFNTLYDYDHAIALQYPFSLQTTTFEPEPEPKPADFATAFASQRFFFSSPGRSNSIVESTSNNTDCTPPSSSYSISSLMATAPPAEDESASTAAADDDKTKKKKKNKLFLNGSVAVSTYSPDPYLDFRRSMQEMVEARPELMDVKSNWDVLQELLLCYLALNPKSIHKFILGAFADLLVSLMSFSSSSSSSSPPPNPNPADVSAGGR
ncbi:transcription repressor OFP16-like [Gastrolobium bilobum]|uniref:transcription repressor OFP16-like n=1 Tax=Gastrolobium bilobum TaxID=150636 RepID=UPI002AAFD8F2|nr:transcription repressor OFP16-like [Gastrolobium bilobum]